MFLLLALAMQLPVTDYHGYVRHDFQLDGLAAIVVEPKKPAAGRPWIWRTEFFDHRPEADLALLAKGFHLVHLAVGNTFGAPEPMHRFSGFYRELTGPAWNLNRRVVLEGFSRGGLYAYNWAVRNPDKVMAIYGDAPVCDFRTWPYGGQGAARSDEDWKQVVASYGFPSEKAALAYPFNPVDSLAPLAKAKIPLLHVIGDADELVPIGPNTMLVEKRYRELHGTIQLIHKPGGHHHPHSLDDPAPIVDFILKHQRDSEKAPPATTIAAPNPESRYTSAGWGDRSWTDQFEDGKVAAEMPGVELVLLGDSITQGFGGPNRQVSAPGAAAYEKYLRGYHTANLGISGDRTQNVLWRVEHDALGRAKPRFVLLTIGINNYPDDSPEAVVKGIVAVARAVRRASPTSRVMVQSLLPAGKSPTDPIRIWTRQVNSMLAHLAKRGEIVPGVDENFILGADGAPAADLVSPDGIHLLSGGYEAWGVKIKEKIESHPIR
ncbi:GDSL-type esterase/lipase family protein [Fimbriimonas ginsengisoli]|uniref:SGNH hydrolase-type esterase domain-containing protein n=1 Tax=Fimbriimonas ginsengisoli Gsoil 348 TaxID=661478 RepID=A0A068NQ24_FIMGI|nr:GDSL-type esterase/lipase family protein [Fimbriimonas ginsengisoli]AIE84860.1 hypothetical protein OP10G_1492 [Fimbriimonas ginsengisoli Gsoil 348]